MRLRSIELKNYRPYKGEVEVEFSEKDDENIFILEGRNGAGKTSLHQAIQWCLYAPYMGGGKAHFDKINDSIESDQESSEMHVRLKFSHEGDEYNVVRQAKIVGEARARTNLEILKNGGPVEKSEEKRQDILDNILPSNVSEFFFFLSSG